MNHLDFDRLTNEDLDSNLVAIYNKTKSEKLAVEKLRHALRSELPDLALGGMEDFNRVFKPFLYSTQLNTVVAPDSTKSSFISISQESPFVVTHLVRGVYRVVLNELDPTKFDEITYIDPKDRTIDGIAPGLKFLMQDSQSTRFFFENPISVDHIGDIKDPYKFNSPQMIAANNNMEFKFFNQNTEDTYLINMTMLGYRVRVEDARNLLSLVTA